MFDPRALDVSGITNALGVLANVNARNAEIARLESERRRGQRRRLLGTGVGLTVGALAAPAAIPGLTAVQGAGYGAAIGGGLASGDPASAAIPLLGAVGAGQAGQDRALRLEAARGVESALSPSPVIDETGRSMPGSIDNSRLLGALSKDPSLLGTTVQTALSLRGQEAAQAAAAEDRSLRLRGQDITLQGQQGAAQTATENRLSQQMIATWNNDNQATIASSNRELQRELSDQQIAAREKLESIREKGLSVDRFTASLMKRAVDASNGVKDAKPLNNVEKQVVLLGRSPNPNAIWGPDVVKENFPSFQPGKEKRAPVAKPGQQEDAAAAKQAISAGADAEAVRKRFKDRWGIDLQ
jgi:hypothetical protein